MGRHYFDNLPMMTELICGRTGIWTQGVRLPRCSLPLNHTTSERRGEVYRGYRLNKTPDSTLSQKCPSFHGTFCPDPVTPFLPAFSLGHSLPKLWTKHTTIPLLPLSNRAAKIFEAVWLSLGGWGSKPTVGTNWPGALEQVNSRLYLYMPYQQSGQHAFVGIAWANPCNVLSTVPGSISKLLSLRKIDGSY